MPRIEFGVVLFSLITLFVVFLLVFCIVRKVHIPPLPFWVITLDLCLVSIPLAILGYENGVWMCLALACVMFSVGFIATIRKK